jgi:hypothetical protein
MKRLEDMTEPELRQFCSACANSIELTAELLEVEKPLFVLVLFNDPKIAQYISNCERATTIEAMRETAERLEKRQDVTR